MARLHHHLPDVLKFIVAVVVCELTGIFGAFFTTGSVSGWYATLQKPLINPPSWVFGLVWTTLYFFMGVAAFLIWRRGWEKQEVRIALAAFGLQLFFNGVWSFIFFGLENTGLALIDIVLLWFAILWTLVLFYRMSRLAAFLMILYLAWVSFAMYLNAAIWLLN